MSSDKLRVEGNGTRGGLAACGGDTASICITRTPAFNCGSTLTLPSGVAGIDRGTLVLPPIGRSAKFSCAIPPQEFAAMQMFLL
ncbi:hypothetical protein J6590_019008 [Homalodisca vitripennis]|nr:hypothetical protein J6590_019008 [Homalodisca vitripennis]